MPYCLKSTLKYPQVVLIQRGRVCRVLEASGASLQDDLPGGPQGLSIGQALLAPTTIYVNQVWSDASNSDIRQMMSPFVSDT